MKIKYRRQENAKDLNNMTEESNRRKSFSIKYPLLAKVMATVFMLEGVCMPAYGAVRPAQKEAETGVKKEQNLPDKLNKLEQLNSIIDRFKTQSKGTLKEVGGYVSVNSQAGQKILEAIKKAGFEIRKDGIYLEEKLAYKFENITGKLKGKKNSLKAEVLAIKIVGEDSEEKPLLTTALQKAWNTVQRAQLKQNVAEAKKEEEEKPVVEVAAQTTTIAASPLTKPEEKLGKTGSKEAITITKEKVIEQYMNLLNNFNDYFWRLTSGRNLPYYSEISITKSDKDPIKKIADKVFDGSSALKEKFEELQGKDKQAALEFLYNHITAMNHVQDKGIIGYAKSLDTIFNVGEQKKEKEHIRKILEEGKINKYPILSAVGMRLFLLDVDERAMNQHEKLAKNSFKDDKNIEKLIGEKKMEIFKNIVDLEHKRLLLIRNKDYKDILEGILKVDARRIFGEEDEFYKMLKTLDVGKFDLKRLEIMAYTLLSICELKQLLELKGKGDVDKEASLELAKIHFKKIFIPGELELKEKENIIKNLSEQEKIYAFNENAALVMANAGIMKVLPYWQDFVAFINRKYYPINEKNRIENGQDALTYLLAYNLSKKDIPHPLRYTPIAQLHSSLKIIADKDYVGTSFTNVVDKKTIDDFYKSLYGENSTAGYHQAFVPALLGVGEDSEHYLIGDKIVMDIIGDKIWSQRDNIRIESAYQRIEGAKKYQHDKNVNELLQKAGVLPIEKLLAFGAPAEFEITKEEKQVEEAKGQPSTILQRRGPPPESFPQPLLPSLLTAGVGETNIIAGQDIPTKIINMFSDKAYDFYDALAKGLNAKNPEEVKDAATKLIDIVNSWNPMSPTDKTKKDDILKVLDKAKNSGDAADFKMSLMTFEERLGVNLLENFFSYRFEGDSLKVRVPIGVEVSLRLGMSEDEIKRKIDQNSLALLTGIAMQLAYLYRPVSGRIQEYQLKGFDEKGKLIVEPTGKTYAATLETHVIDIRTGLEFLAFKAPEFLGGRGIMKLDADLEIDKAVLKAKPEGQPLTLNDWVASFRSIGLGVDFPGGEGFKIRRIELGRLGIGSISEKGLDINPASNYYGSITLAFTEKFEKYQPLALQRLTLHLTPTAFFAGGRTGFSLDLGMQSVHKLSENWYLLPAATGTYLYDGSNNYGRGSADVLFHYAPWGLGLGLGATLDSNLNYSVMLLFRLNLER